MSSLFNEITITKIKGVKKVFLWSGVSILIGEVVVGAILILSQSFNLTIAKLMGTFGLCAVALFIGVNNFSNMEKGERLVQGFALTSLISNVVWLILAILLIWEIIPFVEGYSYYSAQLSPMAKIMSVAVDVAVACFFISNVWMIKETVKPVRPLKITAIICELYCVIYAVVMIFGGTRNANDGKWSALSGLAGFAFVVMTIAAVIVSRSGAKKNEGGDKNGGVSDEMMQTKIQEMVEKEVQARLNAEKAKMGSTPEQPAQTSNVNTSPVESKSDDTVVDSFGNTDFGNGQ